MRRRKVGQLSFADGLVTSQKPDRQDVLSSISKLADWAPIERLVDGLYRSSRGEPAYPPLVMVKVLLLQRWYGLSDPGMEEALSDRLSFLRFAGFALDDATPDHSTIWRFREALGKAGLEAALFEEIARQLDARGLLVKRGTLVDASLVSSAARRPRFDEAKVSPADPDARFGTSNDRGRFAFGYKLHIATDAGSHVVRRLAVTPANVQDVSVAAEVLPDNAGTVYADRGYDSKKLRGILADRGFGDGLMRKGQKDKPLDAAAVARNHALSPTRQQVEKVFGTMKRSYGLARMRAFSITRVRVDLTLFAIAFNIKRWHRLATA